MGLRDSRWSCFSGQIGGQYHLDAVLRWPAVRTAESASGPFVAGQSEDSSRTPDDRCNEQGEVWRYVGGYEKLVRVTYESVKVLSLSIPAGQEALEPTT